MDIGDKQTVLVVDDIPENIDVLNGILKSEYRVIVATNGEVALKCNYCEKITEQENFVIVK